MPMEKVKEEKDFFSQSFLTKQYASKDSSHKTPPPNKVPEKEKNLLERLMNGEPSGIRTGTSTKSFEDILTELKEEDTKGDDEYIPWVSINDLNAEMASAQQTSKIINNKNTNYYGHKTCKISRNANFPKRSITSVGVRSHNERRSRYF